ncbi:unnamed protein product [Blepharisma stoltei]|uniref:SAM domain-containing protein n=1 Tax=Blepharisma stoltei TaxID=1481888 RepID=A0AAU9KNK9_9CILI|nr:unnamed protein product [Blepharisma stoltei]
MIRNPLQWSVSDVVQWLQVINCSGAQEVFVYHGVEGKDLLQLTDADLRFDFKFKRVHDRKYILRKIQELKNINSAIIEVQFGTQVCAVRISDLHSYTFENLRKDVARYFGVDEEKVIIQDKHGLVWGSISVACIFDSNLRQEEAVYLKFIDESSTNPIQQADKAALSEDEEDFNEDNPFHEASKSLRDSSPWAVKEEMASKEEESQEKRKRVNKGTKKQSLNGSDSKQKIKISKNTKESSLVKEKGNISSNPASDVSDRSIRLTEEEEELKNVLKMMRKS